MPFLTLKVTVIALLFLLSFLVFLFLLSFLVFSSLILILLIYFFFFFFLSGKICDGSNGDVAVDQYHRYPVRLLVSGIKGN